jgi:integrase
VASIIRRRYTVKGPDGKPLLDKRGRPQKRACRHYTIQWRDAAGKIKRRKGYTDLGATRQLAATIEKQEARGEQGMVDVFKAHRARPLAEHVREYLADLRATGKDPTYVYNAERRLDTLATECGWATLADVGPVSFVRWREQRRAKGNPKGRGSKKGEGAAPTTLNQFLDTARAFLNWCAEQRRIEGVPAMDRRRGGVRLVSTLLNVTKAEGPAKRKRRALSDEQVGRLLAAAPEGRRLVYRFALATGLRRKELRLLQWGDVRLAAIPPYVQLRAEATKARRGDKVYVPQSLAADLRSRKPEGAKDSELVFADVPDIDTWREDLAAAGIPYKDDTGRQADFHGGTRKTLCTRLHRSGKPLAVAMRVMRHTDARLTMVDYTDDDQLAVAESLLPEVPAAEEPDGGAAAARH